MHLAAAVPMRDVDRLAIVLAGNREPSAWEAYPGHVYLTAGREMSCGNCWHHSVAGPGRCGKKICHKDVHGLPECLDAVTAERVLESFENLYQSGRIRFLAGHDLNFTSRAVAAAQEQNDFDRHNITRLNAPQKAVEFLSTLATYPATTYSGRGVVICAGGVSYFAQAWVCIRMLRQLGCHLPVELWHFENELDSSMAKLLGELNVRCVNATERMKTAPMRNPLGWELKCYAVLHSSFREVLSLDADNVPIVDPTYLFDTAQYTQYGAIFWPDYGQLDRKREIWDLCGVPYRSEPEFESGQMVINKETCWRALNLAWWYNDHSEFFYKYIHGDKDTFHLAWRRTGTEYAMVPHPIESLDGVMCQHDFDGRRIFQHRNSHKWSFFGENKRLHGFLYEEDCRRHLEELRERWDGTVNGEREAKLWNGACVRTQTIDLEVWKCVALHNEYCLPSELSPRDVILDVGAHTGSFAKACHERGSRDIHAFEPHPENFQWAKRNVGSLAGIHLYNGAVLGKAAFGARIGDFTRAEAKQNTGAAQVILAPGPMKTFGINTILEQVGYVSLLKLDCEGSEWSILDRLKQWNRIGAICGEYHQTASAPQPAEKLRKLLAARFAFVQVDHPNEEGLGKFWASHIRIFQRDAYSGHKRKQAQHRER